MFWRRGVLAGVVLVAGAIAAAAQTPGGFHDGPPAPTAGQFNATFAGKQDYPCVTQPPGTSNNTVACTQFVGQQGATYINVMAYCTAAQVAVDITTCAQNAINAAESANVSYGGKVVFFPAQFSPYQLVSGTLTITSSFVSLEGEGKQTTFINCANGSADCVVIGQSSGSQTRDQGIKNLGIWGNGSKTAGAAVHILNAYRTRLENVDAEQHCRGIEVDASTNEITLRDMDVVVNQTCSDYGIYWHASTNGTTRSDVLTLDNVVISGGITATSWSGATGIEWDGWANTMVASHLRILHLTKGMCTSCVAVGTSSSSPTFFNGFDVEMEGFLSIALDMSHGFFQEFKIGESDINNLTGFAGTSDTNAINIGSGVTGAQIVNLRGGDAQQASIKIGGSNVQMSNVQLFGTSVAGSGSFPAIDVLGTAVGTQLHNVVCGEQGGGANLASYCIQLENGSTDSVISNIDALNVVTGAINDLGSTRSSYVPVLRSPTSFTGVAQTQWRDVFQGEMRYLISNGASGTNVKASQEFVTGTANSFLLESLEDANASPFMIYSLGSGVSNGFFWQGPKYSWQSQGGANWLTLTGGLATIFGTTSGSGTMGVSATGGTLSFNTSATVDTNGNLFTASTTASAPASGQTEISGLLGGNQVLSNTSTSFIYTTAGSGLSLSGFGSSNDVVIRDKSGNPALAVPTGTQNLTAFGTLSGVTALTAQTGTLTSAAPTVSSGQIGYGGTTQSAGSATCPSGTVGGQTVAGCIIVNIAGTAHYVPYF